MVFSSGVFLFLFLPAVFLFYYAPVTKSITYRNIVLLLASLFFYAWGEPLFFVIMCFSILADWIIGIKIDDSEKPRQKKAWTAAAIGFHLLLLFVFKYLSFVIKQFHASWHIPIPDIALPIGISFFTFQMMSYIFDVYYGKSKCQRNLYKLALYIMMFPQLIAGPIVRYQTVAEEIDNRKISISDFYSGVTRFIIGLSKKVLIADALGLAADNIFSAQHTQSLPILSAWIGMVSFSFEIYYDFSGYSDMAIGIARCFGFHYKENFRYPYIAVSVTDFWKRWHISLTDWFRDYVYIPLGGNRVSKKKHLWNLAVVWMLTGIWHGANYTFILWGLLYFVFQTTEKYCGGFLKKIPIIIRWLFTMLIVGCNWVIFKADSITLAFSYLGDMFGKSGIFMDAAAKYYAHQCLRLFIVAALGCMPWKLVGIKIRERLIPASPPQTIRAKRTLQLNKKMRYMAMGIKDSILVILLLLSICSIIDGTYSPFIYFNF